MLSLTRRSEVPRPKGGTAPEEAEVPPSFLGPGLGVQGILEIDGELVISGVVKGRIAALKLTIAAGGYVEGDIVAREVMISGRLNGRVFAPTVSIAASAEVEGRLFHTNISVERGARVNGRMPWRPVSYFDTLDQLPENRE
jgi:cytoskeletal protein CcmA (bactofilin family)